MDNISHSVVGLAVGEFIHRSLPTEQDAERQSTRRRMLLGSCWIASNFPDLDILFSGLLPAPLGYLLHHRGHTHTLLYAIPQALLIWGMIWLCWPAARQLLRQSRAIRAALAGSIVTGLGLHILMDFLNSYGVHPFNPYDSRWFYGDMVFIVEPVFWVAFGIPIMMMVQRQWLRSIWIGAMVSALIIFKVKEFLNWFSLWFLFLAVFVLIGAQHKAGMRGRQALILAAVICIGFIGIQKMSSDQAKREVAQSVKSQYPANQVLDVAMTAFPANPVCWWFVSIERNDTANSYGLRRGIISLAPEWLPIGKCPASLSTSLTPQQATLAIALVHEETHRLDWLRAQREGNCYFEAWLRFVRAPSFSEPYATDLRFPAGPKGNFSTMNIDELKGSSCPAYIPRWEFPRQDLLDEKPLQLLHQ